MAQATATSTTAPAAPPAGYGRPFCEIYQATHALTADQAAALEAAAARRDDATYEAAARRLDDALVLLNYEDPDTGPFETRPQCAADAAFAVLARDRGVITAGDFDTITEPWRSTGLLLPPASTGDDDNGVAIEAMTADRICEELMDTAASTRLAGATIALTEYNIGELLAYPAVRGYVERRADGLVDLRWTDLIGDVADSTRKHAFDSLPREALDALIFATSLAVEPAEVRVVVVPTTAVADDGNAETVTLAVAYALDTEHLFDRPEQPAATPAPLASEPGS